MKALSKTDVVIRLGRLNKAMMTERNTIKLAAMAARRANLEQLVKRDNQYYVTCTGVLKRLV